MARHPKTKRSRHIVLSFGPFGRRALQDLADREHSSVAEVVREAAVQLARTHELRTRIPRFLLKRPPVDAPVELELHLDDAIWSTLDRLATSERVSVELLLEHATLCRFDAVSRQS
jgi:hypothetical protein